jgi:GxxExxY protein
MLRIATPLPESTEALIREVIRCCIVVHRALGPGLLEATYVRALVLELRANNMQFEREKVVPVIYRGELLGEHRLDFIVANEVVVEMKAVEALAPIHHAQLLNYMRLAKCRVGLLINFNVPVLKDGVRRKIV